MAYPPLLKIVNVLLALQMILNPFLSAFLPQPIQASPPVESDIFEEVAQPPAEALPQSEPLTATVPLPAAPLPQTAEEIQAQYLEQQSNVSPLMFIENVGQFAVPEGLAENAAPRFQVGGGNSTIFIAPNAIWANLVEPPDPAALEERLLDPAGALDEAVTEEPRKGVNLRIAFEGANTNPRIEGFDPLDTTISYFIGNDPDQWHTNVPVWGGIRYVDLYPGIDLEVTGADGRWEWRLVLKAAAGSQPDGKSQLENVQLRIDGGEGIRFADPDKTALHVATDVGDFSLPLLKVSDVSTGGSLPGAQSPVGVVFAPFSNFIIASGAAVFGRFASPDNVSSTDETPSFVSNYEPELEANIVRQPFLRLPGAAPLLEQDAADHPDLIYSIIMEYYEVAEYGYDIAVDANGAAYIVGDAALYIGSNEWIRNVFVAKLAPTGELLYVTHLGGEENDRGMGIAVDAAGTAYVTGYTSGGFPIRPETSPGAYQQTFGGDGDAFVAKLDPTGELLYATYLGGSGSDSGHVIAVGTGGAVYVSGATASDSDFPIKPEASPGIPGAYQADFGGDMDAFIAKLVLNGEGEADLRYSTYFGGEGDDRAWGIVVDENNAVYVVGHARSSYFPIKPETPPGTPGAYQQTLGGDGDAFVAKLVLDGEGEADLRYSTYFGGGGWDRAEDVAIDADGAVYIAGQTFSDHLPTTTGAFQEDDPSLWMEAFAAKLVLNGGGQADLLYSTYLGGGYYDWGLGMAIDVNGAIYITGCTSSAVLDTFYVELMEASPCSLL